MYVPKTDKWVLVRWHGGVRSVVLRNYLLNLLPPGEELKIAASLRVATSEAGKPDTARILTSGNNRQQLELLSEPGERQTLSDDEQLDFAPKPEAEPEPDVIDENEGSEEDYEESSSDWTPDGPNAEESDSSESDKETSKRNKSVTKSTPNRQCTRTKKSSVESNDVPEKTPAKSIFTKTLDQLAGLYLGPDLKKDGTEKTTSEEVVEGENNGKKREDTPKRSKKKAKRKSINKSMPEVITQMHSVFINLFQVIVSVDPDYHERESDSGDVVVRNKKKRKIKKQTSEYFDKTLTPDEPNDASVEEFEKNKNKTPVIDKTLAPYESDDEPLAGLGKQKTTAPVKNKTPLKLCKDKNIRKLLDKNKTSTPVENTKLADASIEDDSSDCDYSSDRSDDPVLISNKYETMETNHQIPEAEWIPIGSGTTLIHKDKFALVNWKSYTKATRTLLTAAFSRRTLATHSLTGKKSPAFSHKPAKMCLDPKIVSDIVIEVGDKFKVRDNLVRTIITTKCADECKMRKLKKQKKKVMKEKLAQAANEINDAEDDNEENLPTPKKTPKSAKKSNRKSTLPKTRNASKTGSTKTPKKIEIQENEMVPEVDTEQVHPDNIATLPLSENTKSIEKKEEDILSSDDDSAMVIDEDYTPPTEDTALKSIENINQKNELPPENTRMSLDNNEHHMPYMCMRSKNQENIPPPVKKMKGYKTYKNKSKTK